MSFREVVRRIYHISLRELHIMYKNPIYGFCTLIFPLLAVCFFTTLMNEGNPVELPIGVVDEDNTPTTRALIQKLDAFQSTRIVSHYANMNEARQAVQRNQIYGFLLIPDGTTDNLLSSHQPKISLYYSNVTLQPIALDVHLIGNPWTNYNVYLSTAMVPGVIMVFIFLLVPYSIGTELKFHRSRQWIKMAGGNIHIAIAGKMIPQTLIYLLVIWGFEFYIFYHLHFPHPGGIVPILLLGFLAVIACQGFGIFAFALVPSLRMSMSVCSLWSVVSFSACGATFPVFAMSPMIQSLAQLFPLRHYYMIYQLCIFNGYPLSYAWLNIAALLLFFALPVLNINHIKTVMLKYVYTP